MYRQDRPTGRSLTYTATRGSKLPFLPRAWRPSTSTSSSMTTYPMRQVRLGAELESRFASALAEHKLRPSDLLRQAVEHELDRLAFDADSAVPRGSSVGAPLAVPGSAVRVRRLTLRLPDFVYVAARSRGRGRGMALSRWIAALVQSNVAAEPVLSEAETLALEDCSSQLASIGRNINQIARALNQNPHEVDRVRLDVLEHLGDVLKNIRSDIKNLVRASRNVWTVEELR
jgi:GNAT superfamily N-acetyltransferase